MSETIDLIEMKIKISVERELYDYTLRANAVATSLLDKEQKMKFEGISGSINPLKFISQNTEKEMEYEIINSFTKLMISIARNVEKEMLRDIIKRQR